MSKPPKVYFCDVGLASYLLNIENPGQMNRDPLMGNVFENMVVMEALKARYHAGKADTLFFFRNSNSVEVDLLISRHRTLVPYEIQSGKTVNDRHTGNLRKFITRYADFVSSPGGVIYSGDSISSFKGFLYRNFHECSALFEDKEPVYTVSTE